MIEMSMEDPSMAGARLRTELVRLRRAKGVSQEAVAWELEWSSWKVIRIELGKSGISSTDLRALLRYYDMDSESPQHANLLDLAARSRIGKDTAWKSYSSLVRPELLHRARLVASATSILQFTWLLVPALLRTPKYAMALARAQAPVDRSYARDVARLSQYLQRRIATRPIPPHQIHLIDESAIMRSVTSSYDPRIMVDQLNHIVDVCTKSGWITVRILPFTSGITEREAFSLLQHDDDHPSALYFGDTDYLGTTDRSMIFNGDDPLTVTYHAHFTHMMNAARSQKESLALIRDAMKSVS